MSRTMILLLTLLATINIKSGFMVEAAMDATKEKNTLPKISILTSEREGAIPNNGSEKVSITPVKKNNARPFISTRYLRGGSYSGGGSSRYSYNRNSGGGGGSSNYSWNRNRNNGRSSSFGRRLFTGLALGIGAMALFALFAPAVIGGGCGTCLAGLCCGAGLGAAASAASSGRRGGGGGGGYHMSNSNPYNAGNVGYRNPFEERVEEIKNEINSSASSSVIPTWSSSSVPYSGQYNATFQDPSSGMYHSVSLDLKFQRDNQGGGGYFLTGQGSDVDGITTIEEGYAHRNGMAWWIERTMTGDVGLVVISRGRFIYESRTFEGMWLANTMVEAPYMSFTAVNSGSGFSGDSRGGGIGNPNPTFGSGVTSPVNPSIVTVTGTPVGGVPSATAITPTSQNVMTVVGQPVMTTAT